MQSIVLFPLVAQVLVPLSLLTWAGSRHHPSRLTGALTILLAGAWIVVIQLAGLWLALPWWLPAVYLLLLVVAAVRSAPTTARQPAFPAGARGVGAAVAVGVALAAVVAVAVVALLGRRLPASALELAPPLRGGTYLVANGGGNTLVSAHLATLENVSRFRAWRGQSYGVDLVRLGRGGLRAGGLLPENPAEYAIFGDTIIAPCAGSVIVAVDGVPDMPVPVMDREHMAGNHVILGCGDLWILLAHMRRGSVLTRPGDEVAVGAALGLAGNSGNSAEPHLHVHAQRPGTAAMPLGGDPVPITIGGRYLVRGQRVRW